jgi:putative colanic acid biosynthesis glycosyltransferase
LLGDCVFAYGDAIESGHIKRARHDLRYGMITHHQAMVFRRSALRYDTRYEIAADYKFVMETVLGFLNHEDTKARRKKLILNIKKTSCLRDFVVQKITYLPFPICVFETGGVSQRRTAQGRAEQAAIRQELGIHVPFVGVVQACASFVKKTAPKFYWFLRASG